MDKQLLQQCSSTIYVSARIDVDGHGDPAYERLPTKMPVRVEKRFDVKEHAGATGSVETTKTVIYSEKEIKLTDMVWLPGLDIFLFEKLVDIGLFIFGACGVE